MGRWESTHARLLTAAAELFARQGYAATTTAQIAAAAQVSEMTLFRHVPSKEALLLEDRADPAIAAAVRERPATEPALRAAVSGVAEAWGRLPATEVAALRRRLGIIVAEPSLHGAVERNSRESARAIAEALVARGTDRVAARVVASAVVAGLSEALLAWAAAPEESIEEFLGAAFAALAGEGPC
ncbi:TetR/AcrR family transcriptional regulator [Brachybacterium phenoliresistens]|uniref:TetR/AcrR family transcriptional regulator n=1 Tax=Brachybacterium phenoliresistens TaxID=396014 RepID=UPI0031D7BC38